MEPSTLPFHLEAFSKAMNAAPVDLWTVSLLEERPVFLSEEEAARAARFRFEGDRVRWRRARSALRAILSRYAGVAPEALGFVYGPHGKPALSSASNIEFNLSHAGDWALIAVAGPVPVGVDIERIRPHIDMAALLRRLGESVPPDGDLYQAWTRREARSKAAGGALFDPPLDSVRAVGIRAPEGYAAALALVGREPAVTYRGAG
jgi:4'-phosphopantetheinyl transferase